MGNRLRDLEYAPTGPAVRDSAQQTIAKLEALDKEFKSLHFKVIDLINEEETVELEREQEILDKHDDDVASITSRLQQIIAKSDSHTDVTGTLKLLSRKLSRLERSLNATEEALAAVEDDDDDQEAIIK